MDFTKIPCGLSKVSFSRGSFVISVEIGVFGKNTVLECSNQISSVLNVLNRILVILTGIPKMCRDLK